MSITGTFNGASIVALPTSPGLRSVEFSLNDGVSTVTSPYTGQTQTQVWPGADSISGTITLPTMTQEQADNWIAFLMELRGMANCFLIGDPMKTTPRGHVQGFPVVSMTTTGTNAVGSTTLYTRGWTPNQYRLLLPNDCMQIGYRLHRVLDVVDSDEYGNAQINIWPSIRDVLTDGEAITLNNPQGLFRLATNKRTWSSDYTQLTNLSFQILEFR
jgi:hypothetical protein